MPEVKDKTVAQTLYKGRDARMAAIRNNLVRKNTELVDAIGKLTDDEFAALEVYIDPNALVKAARNVAEAMTTRKGAVKKLAAVKG